MRNLTKLLVLPLALTALTACAAQTSSNTLNSSEWRFTAIDGSAPASNEATLSFQADRLNGTVGCNRLGGPWRLENDRLIAGPLMQTKMACEGPVGQQEQNVSALLVSAPEITLDGDSLTLKSSGHSAELRRVSSQ